MLWKELAYKKVWVNLHQKCLMRLTAGADSIFKKLCKIIYSLMFTRPFHFTGENIAKLWNGLAYNKT